MVKSSQSVLYGGILMAIGLVGCGPIASTVQSSHSTATSPTATAALPNVVATSTVLCDLTKQLAEATVSLTCLMQPDQDPHTYTPTPADRKAIEDADLILYGGYNYESSLIKIIQATTTDAAKVAVYEVAVPNPLMGEEHHHEGEHDHGHEEALAEPEPETGESVPDPHVWHSAANGTELVAVLRDRLTQLVPAKADLYQQQATTLTQNLDQIDDWIKNQVATIPAANRKLVTTHEALGYYAKAYGFELEGTLEGISTEEKPSAARLTNLTKQLQAAAIPTIFVDTTSNSKLLETIAREANVKVAKQPLYIEGPGGKDTPAPTYQAMLVSNTCTIVEGLGGKCDRATAPDQGS